MSQKSIITPSVTPQSGKVAKDAPRAGRGGGLDAASAGAEAGAAPRHSGAPEHSDAPAASAALRPGGAPAAGAAFATLDAAQPSAAFATLDAPQPSAASATPDASKPGAAFATPDAAQPGAAFATQTPQASRKLLSCLLDLGESMLISGADVNLVERYISRLGRTYGALRMNVLVITASIVVTMTLPDGTEHTQTRRVEGAGATDFNKLERLALLCCQCWDEPQPMPVAELQRRFREINATSQPRSALYAGGVLAAAGFAVFFGGSWLDALVSAIFAVAICLMFERLKPITPNLFSFNFLASILAGLGTGAVHYALPEMSVGMVMIGDIMLLIPGVALTNATRDMISGDTISGVMRAIESLLWATAIALGFMLALWITGVSAQQAVTNAGPVVQLAAAVPASLGFALFFNVAPRRMVLVTLGGVATWGVYLAAAALMPGNVFFPNLFASLFAAVASEALAQRLRVPTTVFFIIFVIPLIPGRTLFYTMNSAVQSAWSDVAQYGFMTCQIVLAIAVAISVVWAIARTWTNFRARRAGRDIIA